MIKVVGHANVTAFEQYGKEAATLIRDAVARAGADTSKMTAILDFGCGCGRVARHWPSLGPPVHLYGCDYNRNGVEWCTQHLDFLTATTNDLVPPLPYSDQTFDLVYALSVFTHLSEDLHRLWLSELRRVVKAGGLIFFTIKGDQHAKNELNKQDLRRYGEGEFVITDPAVVGTNLCAAYANVEWVTVHMLDGLQLLAHEEQGHSMMGGQETYLVRRQS